VLNFHLPELAKVVFRALWSRRTPTSPAPEAETATETR
jgi:hypothetical protein